MDAAPLAAGCTANGPIIPDQWNIQYNFPFCLPIRNGQTKLKCNPLPVPDILLYNIESSSNRRGFSTYHISVILPVPFLSNGESDSEVIAYTLNTGTTETVTFTITGETDPEVPPHYHWYRWRRCRFPWGMRGDFHGCGQ